MKRSIPLIIFLAFGCLTVFAQTLAQTISQVEERISKLKDAERIVASSIQNTNAIIATAQQMQNPQQYMDFVLLRYERNNRKIQLAIVQVANEAVHSMSEFIGNSNVDQVALKQGIAKYSSLAGFSHKFANELQDEFFKHFSAYLNNYGYDCEEVFRKDNMDLLLEYDVY